MAKINNIIYIYSILEQCITEINPNYIQIKKKKKDRYYNKKEKKKKRTNEINTYNNQSSL